MSAISIPRLTPEEYLAMERAAEFKSEYLDGEMFAMSGGLLAHALIGSALVGELRGALRGKGCRVAGSDLRVGVTKKGPFFYPDVSVFCGEPQMADDHRDTLLNPTLIVEVHSTSTEAFDRGKKFAAYRHIESLREYVLVSQTEKVVESYVRGEHAGEEQWMLREFQGDGATCRFPSIGCEVAMDEIYGG